MDKITIFLKQGHEISKFGSLSRIRIPMANFIKLVLMKYCNFGFPFLFCFSIRVRLRKEATEKV